MEKIKVKRVGEHYMDGTLYMDDLGRYYVDNNNDNGGKPKALYLLCPPNKPDGEPDLMVTNFKITNPLSNREKREEAFKLQYCMLGRLKSDAEAYFDHPGDCRYKNEHFIYGGNIHVLINEMKKYWNEIPEDIKPKWLTWEQIEDFERRAS